jgi:ribA/ribD-fused uncharacterized protein
MRTAEALYQACRFPNKPELQRMIVAQHSPMTAKAKGKPHRNQTREDWEKVRVNLMRWCLRVKLACNWQKFCGLLLATDDKPIVEESTRDDFWGAKPVDEETLVGMNVLGRLLMELREEIRSAKAVSLRQVEPLDIADFLLLGKPIGRVAPKVGDEELPIEVRQEPELQNREQEGSQRCVVIPKQCKRLIEVDFPIAEVSKQSAREKSIRRGHPSTLHLWWARRPLAACRSVLMGLLLPDPCDGNCPADFKSKARELIAKRYRLEKNTDEELRERLLKFIADFSNWDHSRSPLHLEIAHGLVKAAHGNEPPLVVDPFAGGGSIPLEALRLGCDAFASDLNPIACLMNKVLLEDIPRHGKELSDELRVVGAQIKEDAEKELAQYYPPDPDGARPIAYLWARTATCETPGCGAEIPLMRSFWLCKKASRKRALRFAVVQCKDKTPTVEFEIFTPNKEAEVQRGTVHKGNARCLCCSNVLPVERVRRQLATTRGGADVEFDEKGNRIGGAQLLAVVTICSGLQGRIYRLPTVADYQAAWRSGNRLKEVLGEWVSNGKNGLCPVPDEIIAINEIRRVSVPLYGAKTWGDIFTRRQAYSLSCYARIIRNTKASPSCSRLCSLALDRLLILLSAHCRWKPSGESLIDMFGRHAIGMVWDFAESTPGFGSENVLAIWIERFAAVVQQSTPLRSNIGQVQQSDATQGYLPDESCNVWFTDPPYYDSIPYAHLSDCFYVWLRRSLPEALGSVGFKEPLSPKEGECVVDRPHRLSSSIKDEAYFERKIAEAAAVGRRVLSQSGCASIVFAHKTTEGWEALLSGIIEGGWCITASWPIATELSTRLNARDTASLGSSIHLVCRPRPDNAGVGEWERVLRELPNRIGDWMERLDREGIHGADLVFSCIGPGLELFSRYEKVETAEGRVVLLVEYLEKVWEVVGRTALEQILGTAESRARNGAAGVLEEDARLTALFLWTLMGSNEEKGEGNEDENEDELDDNEQEAPAKKKKAGYSLVYDVARRFAQPLGIDLDGWKDRIIEIEKGVVRLLPVKERGKQLFGEKGLTEIAAKLEHGLAVEIQFDLFADARIPQAPKVKGSTRGRKKSKDASEDKPRQTTTLDRVHAGMLLQASGQSAGLRALIESEQKRGPDFIRLANALSALYPKTSDEKRLLDAMLLGLGR